MLDRENFEDARKVLQEESSEGEHVQGVSRDIEQDIKKDCIEVAARMMRDNMDCASISKFTDLSVEEVERLVKGKVKEDMEREQTLRQAIQETVDYCIENDILKDFLEAHGSGVYDMMDWGNFGWDTEDEDKVGREEASEDGRAQRDLESIRQNRIEIAGRMLRDNVDHASISKFTDLPVKGIARLAKEKDFA